MKKVYKFIIIVLLIFIFLLIILLPFIINVLYKKEAFWDFLAIAQGKEYSGYKPSDILNYYGVVMTFIITTGLAVLSIIQTKRVNEKTQELDKLKIEWLKMELKLAESKYVGNTKGNLVEENDGNKHGKNSIQVPKFEITISGYGGYYANVSLKIKNVSSVFVSSLTGIEFKLHNKNGEIIKYTNGKPIPNVTVMEFEKHNLNCGETTKIITNTPNLRVEDNIWNTSQPKVLQDSAEMIFKFSCEDEYFNKFFYKASVEIPDTKISHNTIWKCERIG